MQEKGGRSETYKTVIIRRIFFDRFDEDTCSLADPVVTLQQASVEIARYNEANADDKKSTKNPANFFKDIIRNRSGANRHWPRDVFDKGFIGRQLTGAGQCFEFALIEPGQFEPYPASDFVADAHTPVHRIESVSMPLASRRLGRADEPWLIQVVTRLRILETHFSVYSKRKAQQLDLLQLNVKLNRTEIDALFLLIESSDSGDLEEVIVTCEAKGAREDIIEEQILQQAQVAFRLVETKHHRVVPVAIKVVGRSKILVVEFAEILRESVGGTTSLTVASKSLFEIVPDMPGIGTDPKRSPTS
jgi:hypothetical protein